jgi:hypothetical protein
MILLVLVSISIAQLHIFFYHNPAVIEGIFAIV